MSWLERTAATEALQFLQMRIPGGVEHGFVNVTDKPARQYMLIAPALDAEAFFTELAATMRDGLPDQAALNAFGLKWNVEFLGPPLRVDERPTD